MLFTWPSLFSSPGNRRSVQAHPARNRQPGTGSGRNQVHSVVLDPPAQPAAAHLRTGPAQKAEWRHRKEDSGVHKYRWDVVDDRWDRVCDRSGIRKAKGSDLFLELNKIKHSTNVLHRMRYVLSKIRKMFVGLECFGMFKQLQICKFDATVSFLCMQLTYQCLFSSHKFCIYFRKTVSNKRFILQQSTILISPYPLARSTTRVSASNPFSSRPSPKPAPSSERVAPGEPSRASASGYIPRKRTRTRWSNRRIPKFWGPTWDRWCCNWRNWVSMIWCISTLWIRQVRTWFIFKLTI